MQIHAPKDENPPWVLQESRAQVVRSVGRWSAGTKTESSTHQAYCDLIQDSKHFIYIENQFFCSGLEGRAGKVQNDAGLVWICYCYYV